MSLEIILPLAAVIILLILLSWVFRVLKVTLKTAVILLGIFLLLQVIFGINSQDLIQEVFKIVDRILQLILGNQISQ